MGAGERGFKSGSVLSRHARKLGIQKRLAVIPAKAGIQVLKSDSSALSPRHGVSRDPDVRIPT